jgi:peptide-methionine (S)-S-oxide reductase
MTPRLKNPTPRRVFRHWRPAVFLAGLVLLAGIGMRAMPSSAEEAHTVPLPTLDETANAQATSETVVLAGGCFWGVQGVFSMQGVTSAVSGYAGGQKNTAQYETVSSGTTGHAESVQVTFDPRKITLGRILQVYFSVAHDPTELNYQGPDSGTQYRSTIFPTTPEQARIAKAYIAQLDQAIADGAIVTAIEPGRSFYPAEGYHQNFLTLNPNTPISSITICQDRNLKRCIPTSTRRPSAPVRGGSEFRGCQRRIHEPIPSVTPAKPSQAP